MMSEQAKPVWTLQYWSKSNEILRNSSLVGPAVIMSALNEGEQAKVDNERLRKQLAEIMQQGEEILRLRNKMEMMQAHHHSQEAYYIRLSNDNAQHWREAKEEADTLRTENAELKATVEELRKWYDKHWPSCFYDHSREFNAILARKAQEPGLVDALRAENAELKATLEEVRKTLDLGAYEYEWAINQIKAILARHAKPKVEWKEETNLEGNTMYCSNDGSFTIYQGPRDNAIVWYISGCVFDGPFATIAEAQRAVERKV